MNIGLVLQARTGSTRLPEKMLMPFYCKKTILDVLLQRIIAEKLGLPIVLATTTNERDIKIYEIAERNSVFCFRGSETDVLKRFIDTAQEYKFDAVIRICADNPFLSMKYLRKLLEYIKDNKSDYVSFQTSDGTPSIKTHFGFWAEYITVDALRRIQLKTDDSLFHEHVTNYAYTNRDLFCCNFLPIEDFIERSNIRLTVDTADDFQNASKLYETLLNQNLSIEPQNIIPLIDSEMKLNMSKQIILNSK